MTSSIRSNPGRPAPNRLHAGRPGFTLVELLVVMGIILVLIALLFPSLNAAWKGSVRTRVGADLATIATALEAYKQDYGDYPRVYADNTGPLVLTMALVGPGDRNYDGQDGPGWRPRVGGKVQPAYLPAEKFPIVHAVETRATPPIDPNFGVLGDRWNSPILYIPGNKGANPRDPGPASGYVAEAPHVSQTATAGARKPMYNAKAAGGYFDHTVSGPAAARRLDIAAGTPRLQVVMGDVNRNGYLDAGEAAAFEGPYLLWSAGSDEKFGPKDALPVSPKNRCDDITNFPRSEY
jgi:prepilin-type N-terminal cleavage/methylation domain-containing protein